jgi:2-polyprenyl-3-methyl-5-hydroxy-6-metoxy-1,4-benzoquinol methylase
MLRCPDCTFVYARDRHVPPAFYDAAYTQDGEYSGLLNGALEQKQGRAGFDWMHEWTIARVRPFGQRRMLDLGCGVGSAAFLAQRAGWDAHGQDVSENALRVAREVFGIKASNDSIESLVELGQRFEFITAFNLIEHLPDPMPYLKTVRRLVTDDGYFGVAVPNYDSYAMRHTSCPQWLPPYHLSFFTLRTLRTALAGAGFELFAHKIKFAAWSGVEGPKWRRLGLVPYLVANALIGRLRGGGIVALARAGQAAV